MFKDPKMLLERTKTVSIELKNKLFGSCSVQCHRFAVQPDSELSHSVIQMIESSPDSLKKKQKKTVTSS